MLYQLAQRSIFVLREAEARFDNPAVLWSGGKDSTTILSLIRESFFGMIPWDVVFIETGHHPDEMIKFRDKIAQEWEFKLRVVRSHNYGKFSPEDGVRKCCTALKTEALKDAIKEHGYDAYVVSIRRDEEGIRNKERYMSPRDKEQRWDYAEFTDEGKKSLQEPEFEKWGLLQSDFGANCQHVRVHPLLHWSELDVWSYIKDRDLPVNPLYFAKDCKRFRSLGCAPCSSPIDSDATTVDEILAEIRHNPGGERSGRSQDKEKVMEALRAMGYP